ncbi:MAG TPA: META domain-containing protein [Vicingus sp.]|nr:META domain-containing protein [Vicingus sp.]HRP60756.1 META domain-containing protein [Vicingus sp.]
MTKTTLLTPFLLTLIIFSCKSIPNYSSTSNNIITDKYWKLIELNGKKIIAEQQAKEAHVVLKIEENRIVGNGGCNSFFGMYQLKQGDSIQLSPLGSTKMACLNNNVEDEFLKVLAIADNYTLKNDTLSLNKAKMAPLARFELVIKQH